MASQNPQKVVHQDYIVRQRYSNTLPPPPGDPKLLEIPSTGLTPYTMPLFASRMARNQPVNIEADAFLGMPIDLVGMPGVFDGDESSIQAPLVPPTVHPADRNLLRPLKALGKPKSEVADVSFLRRTQYTAEDRSRTEPGGHRNPTASVKRRKTDVSKEDPITILRSTIKGFDVANPESAYKGPDTAEHLRGLAATPAEIDAWKNPRHPTKPNLKMVDSYPLIPDLEGMTDEQGFYVFKFSGNPTDVKEYPDPQMSTALMHPLEPSARVAADYQAKVAAHKADPDNSTDPGLPPLSYEYFQALDAETAIKLSRKFDANNPDKDDPDLYTFPSEGGGNDCFRYTHTRIYDPGHQIDLRATPYQEIAIALYDPELEKKKAEDDGEDLPNTRSQKGAFYYPIMQKQQLKPRRAVKMGGPSQQADGDDEKIDNLDVHIRDPDDEDTERRSAFVAAIDTKDDVMANGTAEADSET